MNILKIQDTLKNLSDDQLAQEMRLPSGTAPQYLIMTEMQRRQKMREEFSGNEPPKTTMAEEMSGEAPPAPQAGAAPPQEPDANAQGLMGLPDQTMAGNAMRAKISGQPQQVDDMTVMPPQGMAAGGAVTFGDPFAGAFQQGSTPYQGYAPVQSYSPKPYTPPKEDYSDFRHQFDGRPTPRTPNPRVRMSEAERYGLPAGMAAPTYGTPGLNRTTTGRDGHRTRYSWENDAARDAYIRYMTPPAKAEAAPAAGANAPVAKAGGGPIRMFAGKDVDGGEDRFTQGLREMSPDQLLNELQSATLRARRDAAKAEIDRRNTQTNLGSAAEKINEVWNPANNPFLQPFIPPSIAPPFRKIGDALFSPANPQIVVPPTPDEMARLAQRNRGGTPKPLTPEQIAAGNAPESANAPEEAPALEGMPAFKDDYASLQMPEGNRPTPPSAAISGLPSLPNIRPSGGGIASLPKPEKDTSYEDYMKQANALIGEAGGDPAAEKDRSFYNALMKLGLGMASSKNQSLLGAVAEGGLPALQQYTEDAAQRRKDARALAGEKLAVLGTGTQMRQSAEKDYRDQLNKAEDLRLRGRETEAKMLADEASLQYQLAGLKIREMEAANTNANQQADTEIRRATLEETRRSNEAAENKLPDVVLTLQAQYGDKWRDALEVQTLQDNLDKYKALAQANLQASEMGEAAKYNAYANAAAKRLEAAMERLYGSGGGNIGTQIRRVDASGNPVQ